MEKYLFIIKEKGLWNAISANNLDINFIRKHKEHLDWKTLKLTNYFSDEEKIEFINELLPSYFQEKNFVSNEPERSIAEIETSITEANYKWEKIKEAERNAIMKEMANLTAKLKDLS